MCAKLVDVVQLYNQHPKLKKRDVNTIFEWLQTQQHLPELTELQVILFLHSCYFEIESTKITIDNYFTLRATSDLFLSCNEESIRTILSTFFTDVLPKKTPENYCIWSFRMLDPNANFDFNGFVRISIMIITLYFYQHGPTDGLIVIADLSKFSFQHLFKMSPNGIKVILQFLQEAIPTRIKGVHFVNVASATKGLIALARPFMKKEVYDVIRLHPNSFDSFYEFVSKDCLPEEYGGDLGSIYQVHERTLSKLLENLDFFEWHDAQQVDETKRVGKRSKGFR